jgi:hypothetical protein
MLPKMRVRTATAAVHGPDYGRESPASAPARGVFDSMFVRDRNGVGLELCREESGSSTGTASPADRLAGVLG